MTVKRSQTAAGFTFPAIPSVADATTAYSLGREPQVNIARRRQQAAERRQIASGPPRAVGYTKRFMLSLLRSFWADSLAETWGWHPMLYAVAAPQLSELTRGALASPRPQAMLFNHFVVGLENKYPLPLPKSREAMIAMWISRHLFSARSERRGYVFLTLSIAVRHRRTGRR
ncbi:hypothetical protein Pla52n_44440 [Stieleria varia]|uniref:Uncharacterized protein n=1 Tax=Stieleria varia TaxID=2528005 RepID=A0A5C6ALZ0_9BACT|nr:hypothetical protein Pla52n_44440 [Stieleria varia]